MPSSKPILKKSKKTIVKEEKAPCTSLESEFVFHIYALDFAGFDIPGALLFRTLIGKIFGSIGSVGGGLALGKEGPLVHTGAYIASLLGQGGSTKYHLNSRWQQFFKSDRDRRDLLELLPLLEEVKSWWVPSLTSYVQSG
ncbi:unnamed protein product [Arabidopsis arenosa]|uniref:Uncharacterized protein n=1 Tax=Arabidopsis arenosa TaxID=38785 RepID=A0A8S2APV0_ARAAE|nr:unnamed protein product [Arabidopsis arenosa]